MLLKYLNIFCSSLILTVFSFSGQAYDLTSKLVHINSLKAELNDSKLLSDDPNVDSQIFESLVFTREDVIDNPLNTRNWKRFVNAFVFSEDTNLNGLFLEKKLRDIKREDTFHKIWMGHSRIKKTVSLIFGFDQINKEQGAEYGYRECNVPAWPSCPEHGFVWKPTTKQWTAYSNLVRSRAKEVKKAFFSNLKKYLNSDDQEIFSAIKYKAIEGRYQNGGLAVTSINALIQLVYPYSGPRYRELFFRYFASTFKLDELSKRVTTAEGHFSVSGGEGLFSSGFSGGGSYYEYDYVVYTASLYAETQEDHMRNIDFVCNMAVSNIDNVTSSDPLLQFCNQFVYPIMIRVNNNRSFQQTILPRAYEVPNLFENVQSFLINYPIKLEQHRNTNLCSFSLLGSRNMGSKNKAASIAFSSWEELSKGIANLNNIEVPHQNDIELQSLQATDEIQRQIELNCSPQMVDSIVNLFQNDSQAQMNMIKVENVISIFMDHSN